MGRQLKEEKSPFCLGCDREFGDELRYHSRDRCNACYQKFYAINKGVVKSYVKTIKSTSCKECNKEYGSLNEKGRKVTKASNGYCKTCYYRKRKGNSKTCIKCGNIMRLSSINNLCKPCKANKRKKSKQIVDRDTLELIRILMVRYKFGNNTLVDNLRVVDVYMDLNDNAIQLDTLTEESQVVEMLRNLKSIYDFNKERL